MPNVSNIKKVRDFVLESGNVFICPTAEDTTEILKFNENDKLELVSTEGHEDEELEEEDNHLAFKNHNMIVGCLRKAVEMGIAHTQAISISTALRSPYNFQLMVP